MDEEKGTEGQGTEEQNTKQRSPEEAELYWNWQPGSIQITKWPDGWKVLDMSDIEYEEEKPVTIEWPDGWNIVEH